MHRPAALIERCTRRSLPRAERVMAGWKKLVEAGKGCAWRSVILEVISAQLSHRGNNVVRGSPEEAAKANRFPEVPSMGDHGSGMAHILRFSNTVSSVQANCHPGVPLSSPCRPRSRRAGGLEVTFVGPPPPWGLSRAGRGLSPMPAATLPSPPRAPLHSSQSDPAVPAG